MLNEKHCYILNFRPYKMVYLLSHKLAFSNLSLLPFYEHFVNYARNVRSN